LAAKRLELLREMVPGAARIAVLVNPASATTAETTLRDVAAAAHVMGLQIQVLNASTSREIDAAFATFMRERSDAVFVGLDIFLLAAAPNWSTWHRATRSPRHIPCENSPKLVG
jgi:putative ABC transport system substrate-binding protein